MIEEPIKQTSLLAELVCAAAPIRSLRYERPHLAVTQQEEPKTEIESCRLNEAKPSELEPFFARFVKVSALSADEGVYVVQHTVTQLHFPGGHASNALINGRPELDGAEDKEQCLSGAKQEMSLPLIR
ncbi:unnamed protein product [Lota lota]